MPTKAEIEAGRSPAGGWTKAQLAEWGIPWPPPKGWKRKLAGQQPRSRRPPKVDWKIGPCPRCLSSSKHDDAGYPLRQNWCDDCGFTYTLWLQDPATPEELELDEGWYLAATAGS